MADRQNGNPPIWRGIGGLTVGKRDALGLAMKYTDLGSCYNVRVSRVEVEAFKQSYPCSGLPDKSITFQFDKWGNLIDIFPDSSAFDGPALFALSLDAQAFGDEKITLRNLPRVPRS